jgi:photosystem II stability/assembly factor-like uncharacterized protein
MVFGLGGTFSEKPLQIIRYRRQVLACCFYLTALLAPSGAFAEFATRDAVDARDPASYQLAEMAWRDDRLFTVGERGLIAYSDDNGASWQQASVPVSATLTAITFTTSGQGWAVGHGGTILRSNDAGESWEKVFDGIEANEQFLAWAKVNIQRLKAEMAELEGQEEPDEMAIEDAGYALEDAVFALDDAEVAVETGPADPLLDVHFVDNSIGIVVGAYNMLYRTEDGGETWELAIDSIDNSYRYHLYSITEDASGRVHVSGEAGLLFYSDDQGKTWTRTEDVYDGSLFSLVAGPDAVLAVGLRGNVFRSVDGGESWANVPMSGTGSLYNGVVTDQGIYLVGTGGRIVLSTDQGQTFTEFTHPSRAALSAITTAGEQLLLAGSSGILLENLKEFSRE